MLAQVLPIFAQLGFGALAGAARLFDSPRQAISVLNRYALFVAFPWLIIGSLASATLALPENAGFYLVHLLAAPLALLAVVGSASWSGRLRAQRGSIASASIFGNIAYLGIPFSVAVLGERVAGLAALSASMHLVIGITTASALLGSEASGPRGARALLLRVAGQPLVWSPLIGLVLRSAPGWVRSVVVAVGGPIGASAAPVALFMLGLYIFEERHHLRSPDGATLLTTFAKLVIFPAIVGAVAWALHSVTPLTTDERAICVLIAAMPTAVTTFALAEQFEAPREAIAKSIVLSTVACLVTLPLSVRLLLDGPDPSGAVGPGQGGVPLQTRSQGAQPSSSAPFSHSGSSSHRVSRGTYRPSPQANIGKS